MTLYAGSFLFAQTAWIVAGEIAMGFLLTFVWMRCFRAQTVVICLYLFCLMTGVQVGYLCTLVIIALFDVGSLSIMAILMTVAVLALLIGLGYRHR